MNKLQELRKSKGDTQKKLAELLGVSEMTISRWEKEKELKIKYEYTQKLADYFGVSVGYLLGHSEYRDSQEANFHLNKINPDDPYNLVRARICSILGDDLMEELERQYVTGYDDPDYSNLISFLSAVNQLSYTDEEELLLNYGILPKEDKKIVKNLVSDMAEKVKIANKKEPWEKGF